MKLHSLPKLPNYPVFKQLLQHPTLHTHPFNLLSTSLKKSVNWQLLSNPTTNGYPSSFFSVCNAGYLSKPTNFGNLNKCNPIPYIQRRYLNVGTKKTHKNEDTKGGRKESKSKHERRIRNQGRWQGSASKPKKLNDRQGKTNYRRDGFQPTIVVKKEDTPKEKETKPTSKTKTTIKPYSDIPTVVKPQPRTPQTNKPNIIPSQTIPTQPIKTPSRKQPQKLDPLLYPKLPEGFLNTELPPPNREELDKGKLYFKQSGTELSHVMGKIGDYPKGYHPQVAFAGRSNVGKSSLINKIINSKDLVRTSATPGCTQTLNFYLSNDQIMLVDFPGYGYANASKKDYNNWLRMIYDFLTKSQNLRRVFILVDSRHGICDYDREVFDLLDKGSVPYQVVLTKIDKLKPAQLNRAVQGAKKEIENRSKSVEQILVTSSQGYLGVNEMQVSILTAVGIIKERPEHENSEEFMELLRKSNIPSNSDSKSSKSEGSKKNST
eukprot:TRINITY_DN5194_c0_g1_i1.p1 TRINITY_DN5194_c0_g1~~TRINITY_DN5194_c0_g1_i1.p1  ORF type:complete len:490 (+),score=95.17 TRINITY_DN5194_c0_g1_i1:1442-2911(+)